MLHRKIVVIGGGPAGMSAALAAYESGESDILILERDTALGGILQQCIHCGFGLHRFGEELSGPEYAYRYEKKIREKRIEFKLGATVINITPDKVITVTSAEEGIVEIKAEAIILAMGCRERPRGALNIPGDRPSGIYSAGMAQKLVNMMGYMPGKNVVILGSGDIGLIMARRMTLEGARVHAVCELMPYSGGLARNIEQCLNDFNIPLLLSHTVTKIHGNDRLTGVTISKVDDNRQAIVGTEKYIECDTLLLSVGLIPENELTKGAGLSLEKITGGTAVDQDKQTDVPGIFSCGNALHVHDLVDFVSEEAEIAGKSAAAYVRGELLHNADIKITTDGNIRYTVPQRISAKKDVSVYFRVGNIFENSKVVVKDGERVVFSKKKEKVSPGEMECIRLSAEQIKNAQNLSFSIEKA